MKESAVEFHEIKAFTKQGVSVIGNPACVTIVEEFPDDATMGAAARQLGSPMTTFVKPTFQPDIFEIRHFSPDGDECHICGHATMAAVEFLAQKNPGLRNDKHITMLMNPKFGVSGDSKIDAHIDGVKIALTMPAILDLQPMTDPEFYKVLCEGLRVSEDALQKPVYFAPRIRDLVVAFKDPDVLLNLNPDFPKLKAMAIEGKYVHEGLMGTAKSNIPGFDVINRVFLPGIDVNEDVACGSGNCSVIPFWATKSGAFPAETTDFKVVYPYPPGKKGYVGGIQQVHIDVDAAHILLAGEASLEKTVTVQLRKGNPDTGSAPKP